MGLTHSLRALVSWSPFGSLTGRVDHFASASSPGNCVTSGHYGVAQLTGSMDLDSDAADADPGESATEAAAKKAAFPAGFLGDEIMTFIRMTTATRAKENYMAEIVELLVAFENALAPECLAADGLSKLDQRAAVWGREPELGWAWPRYPGAQQRARMMRGTDSLQLGGIGLQLSWNSKASGVTEPFRAKLHFHAHPVTHMPLFFEKIEQRSQANFETHPATE